VRRSEGASGDALDGLERLGRGSTIARDLRRLAEEPSERRARGTIICEGIHLFQEALKSRVRIDLVLLSPRLLRTPEGRETARHAAGGALPAKRVDDDLLATLATTESHQGILFVAQRPAWSEADLLAGAAPPRVVVASGIQDPGNLGALARIAEASYGSGLVRAGAGADPFSPRSLRSAAGSLFRLPVIEYPGAEPAAAALRNLGFRLLGASPGATTSYTDADLSGSLALFVGSEGAGLPQEVCRALDGEVRIPLREGVESLNVAAAAAVILFEARRRLSGR
jgi:TrmH family RNA methyltransferase